MKRFRPHHKLQKRFDKFEFIFSAVHGDVHHRHHINPRTQKHEFHIADDANVLFNEGEFINNVIGKCSHGGTLFHNAIKAAHDRFDEIIASSTYKAEKPVLHLMFLGDGASNKPEDEIPKIKALFEGMISKDIKIDVVFFKHTMPPEDYEKATNTIYGISEGLPEVKV